MRKIVDVTQLVRWPGKLTGIPRVMYELASRFDDAEYVVWNGAQTRFDRVEKPRLEEEKPAAPVVIAISPSLAKRIAKKIYHRLPPPMKAYAQKTRHSLVVKQKVELPDQGFIFKKGDRLLVAWGEWGDPAYRNKLGELVNNVEVDLYQIAYDMLPLVTPQYSSHSTESLGRYVEEVYPLCKQIIAISNHTKKDVSGWMKERKLKIPPIKVIRLGDDFQFAEPKQPEHSFLTGRTRYILCVGTVEVRKNHVLLYYAYKLAVQRGIKLPKLVIVGRRGWLTENLYELMTTDPETKDSFIFLHNTSDEELSWLYTHSLFSVYPSLYEGWGLPIAESVSRGVPCACSNTSSMTEVAGDLVTYFSPTSTDECLHALQYLLDDTNRREAKKRLSKYHQVSWDITFSEISRIMR